MCLTVGYLILKIESVINTRTMNAGVDLECGSYSPYEHFFAYFPEEQIAAGKVSEERVDEAVRRVLIARIKAGQFEEKQPFADIPLSVIGCEKHEALSYEAAVKSMVLLKNNGILPLSEDKKILVVGSNAAVCAFGDYSGKPVNAPVSPVDGIRKRVPDVSFVRWDHVKAQSAFTEIPAHVYCTGQGEKGIEASFYANAHYTGFPQKRIDEAVNYAWRDRYPDPLITTKEFSCVFRGALIAPNTGKYTFRLSAGGHPKCCPPELIPDGSEYDNGEIFLKKGEKLPFLVRYSGVSGEPYVKLEWTVPAGSEEEAFTEEVSAARDADAVIAVLGLGTE